MTDPHTVDVGGPWFEDFAVGQAFDAPAVTLTAGHAALLHSLAGDRLRLPLDHHASAIVTGVDRPLAHPLLAINVAIGQSTWASQRVKANLFYRGLLLQRAVHLGDTLATATRVVALRQNRTQPGRAATGLVALEMTTHNQRGEEVLHFWRCPMIPCRDAEAATGHADDLAPGRRRRRRSRRARRRTGLGHHGGVESVARTQGRRHPTRHTLRRRGTRHGHVRPGARARHAQHGDGAHRRESLLPRRPARLRRPHDLRWPSHRSRARCRTC